MVSGGRAAVDAALESMKQWMATVGARLEDVVKLTYFVTDLSLRDAANEQYLELWPQPRPAHTVVGVAALPQGCEVEIDAAVKAP